MDRSREPACCTRTIGWMWFALALFPLRTEALAQSDLAQCDSASCDAVSQWNSAAWECGELESGCRLGNEFGRVRTALAESGITLQNNLTQFYMGNTAGGLDREFRYSGHGDYLINADLGKLGVQPGLFLKVRAEHRFGESLAGATGAILPANVAADLPVSDIENIYLTNVLLTQALSESLIVFAGKLDSLDGDLNAFAHGRGIRQFSNMAFVGTPIALRTVPYSTLGLGFAYLSDGVPLFSFSVLNATDTTRTSGFDELFAEGVVLTSELRLPTNFFQRPGHQLFGGTWSSRDLIALGQDPRVVLPSVPIARQSDSWSLYWNCDQYLVSDPCDRSRGWGYFARAGIADDDTNPLSYYLSAGLGGSSPIAGRDGDSFGIGYYYAEVSNQVGDILTALLGSLSDGQGVELFYNAAITRSLTVTPDIQVISPARDSVNTALVAGVRANMAF